MLLVIQCRLTADKRMEVDGYLSCSGLAVKGPVVFTIDTGSPVTSLGHKDAMAMNLNPSLLRRSRRPFIGIGGFAESFELADVDIVISGGGQEAYCHLVTMYYHKPVRRKRTKTDKVFVHEREATAAAPSILGFDALIAMRLVLETDFESSAILKPRP